MTDLGTLLADVRKANPKAAKPSADHSAANGNAIVKAKPDGKGCIIDVTYATAPTMSSSGKTINRTKCPIRYDDKVGSEMCEHRSTLVIWTK